MIKTERKFVVPVVLSFDLESFFLVFFLHSPIYGENCGNYKNYLTLFKA